MILQNCQIIDCTGAAPYAAPVQVENGLITAIGAVEPDAEVVDCGGGFLLPGLVNLHVHINRRHLSRGGGVFRQGAPAVENESDGVRMLYAARNAWYELSRGVTTLRDLSSVGRTASELKRAIEAGIIRGPRLFVCGLGIAATGGHETHRYRGAVEADGPDEVLKAARYELRLGADFLKLMASGGIGGMPEHEHPGWSELTEEEIHAACVAAHSHNRGVTVHAMGRQPVLNALRGGVDGIEHGCELCDEALEIMADRGVYYVPTASGITNVAEKERKNGNSAMADLIWELVAGPQRESIRRAHERGLLMGAGSDTLGSVLEELLIFRDCGLTTYEALQTATKNAAEILKNQDRFGTIEVGKTADLLLVRENPLEDLRNLEQVEAVYLGGERVTEAWMCRLQ